MLQLLSRYTIYVYMLIIALLFIFFLHSWNNIFWMLQLEMEDGDEIDAMLHQTGGAFMM